MPLSTGTRLGGYEILSALGAGGMGEVYRARDTRLDRHVAIKILPQAFVADAERVARFQREAKVLASLNHPNIATIYGLEEAEHGTALVMELVEGEDLSDRLRRGPIPLDEALPIAKQIAEALEAAHGQGIIHRDLKPANIKARTDGTVKVLDFGLAKATVSDVERPDLADSPTVTAVATRAGTLLGTASYMSPEQAKGRPVDRRTDVWAFGAVLFELLTGKRAFQGESVAEILSHVLTRTPNWDLLPAATPASIRTLLRRCLEKNAMKRLDSAAAVRLEIDDTLAAPSGVTTPSVPEGRRRRVPWVAAVAAVVTAGLIGVSGTWAVMRPATPAPELPVRFEMTFPATAPLDLGDADARDIAISPDGRYVAYTSRGRLMLRALDRLDVVLVTNNVRGPFFSHDSRWIGFFDGDELKKVSITGETVLPICRGLHEPQAASWGDDDTIVVASSDPTVGLSRVSANGGEARVLTRTAGKLRQHLAPLMLPGSRGVAFTTVTHAFQDRKLAVLDLESGEEKTLALPNAGAAEYLDSGYLVYASISQGVDQQVVRTLWVVAFDVDRLALRGEPVRVSAPSQVDFYGGFAVSRTGALIYVPHAPLVRSFVWVDRTTGRETPITGLAPDAYFTMDLSHDDTRVAFAIANREFDIWTWELSRGALSPLTRSSSDDFLPRWTPDDLQIVFRSLRDGRPGNMYMVAADRSGPVQRLMPGSQDRWPNSITSDGKDLLFVEGREKTGYDIFRIPLAAAQGADNTAIANVLEERPAHQFAANISPDGRYFAYTSNETGGQYEIYVRPYSDAGTKRWKISAGGGMAPVWAPSGKELFYLESGTLMAVSVQTTGPEFIPGKPAKAFPTNAKYWGDFYSYDVTKDGRFLMLKEGDRRQPGIVVVLDWFEELKRLEGLGRAR